MRFPLLLAIIALLPLTATPARADQVYHYGQLICEGNRALIRFATAYNQDEPVFPADPSAPPFTATPPNSETCRLADGREVRVKTGGRMPTAWGMCGGASNTYISLWVGERKVLSRLWVQNGCFTWGEPYADIIILDGDTLTLCASAASVERLTGAQKPYPGCRDASDQLLSAVHDDVEYPADPSAKPKVGTITAKFSEDRYLCAAFLRPDSPHDAFREANSIWPQHKPAMMAPPVLEDRSETATPVGTWFALPVTEAEEIKFQPVIEFPDDPKSMRMLDPSYAWIDFDNDRKPDMVFREKTYSGSGVYEAFHVYSDGVALGVPDKLNEFLFDERQVWPSLRTLAAMNLPPPAEYRGILPDLETDFPEGFTLQFAFRYRNQTYVFASPFFRETNPKAVIYRPLPGGKAEPVCIYDMVQENY